MTKYDPEVIDAQNTDLEQIVGKTIARALVDYDYKSGQLELRLLPDDERVKVEYLNGRVYEDL